MNPLERKIIYNIVRNGGLSHEPYEFGAYRPQGPNEEVDPKLVQQIKERAYVPVRIYGTEPPEIKANPNRKMSPMPSPISPKKDE